MGIITSSLSFLLGTGCGIYIAQNYNVPNVKELVNTWVYKAKGWEDKYRKRDRD
ncbi:uncharacterized protein LOC122000010 [Zingiber officinale]|nr:uncharacterized protein LOC122000010 [Zingiber officinale]